MPVPGGLPLRKCVCMSIRYNPASLAKIEKLIEEADISFVMKGEPFRVVTVSWNKKGCGTQQISADRRKDQYMIDIVPILDIRPDHLSAENRKMYEEIISRIEMQKD
jgi:hypothetical protein